MDRAPPLAAGIAAVATSQALGGRMSVATTTVSGLLLTAAGLLVLSWLTTDSLALVVLGLALVFAGLMPVLARGVDIVTGAAAPERAGAASALTETTQELGSALGIALLGSITAAVYRNQVAATLERVPEPVAAAVRETLAGALRHSDALSTNVVSTALRAFTEGAGLAAALTACAVLIVAIAAGAAAADAGAPGIDLPAIDDRQRWGE